MLSSGDQQGTREYVAESNGDGAGGTGPICECSFLELLFHVKAASRMLACGEVTLSGFDCMLLALCTCTNHSTTKLSLCDYCAPFMFTIGFCYQANSVRHRVCVCCNSAVMILAFLTRVSCLSHRDALLLAVCHASTPCPCSSVGWGLQEER